MLKTMHDIRAGITPASRPFSDVFKEMADAFEKNERETLGKEISAEDQQGRHMMLKGMEILFETWKVEAGVEVELPEKV